MLEQMGRWRARHKSGRAGDGRGWRRHPGRERLGLVATLALLLLTSPSTAGTACRIAVLGDSLSSAHGLAMAEGFPAQLQERLAAAGFACEVLDAAVSGDTTRDGLARLDWMLADRPSHVIVELGGNDGLRALPPEEMEANLEAIIRRLQDEGIPVLLAGMLAPPNLGREYGEAFAAVFPRLADKYDIPLYPFVLDGVVGRPELFQADGIHPTAEGIAVMVEGILPTVTAWLEQR